jgi:uncharacterized protein YndB with AHSA1/START domain
MTGPSKTISLSLYVACPPNEVWDALTQPSLIARWWGAGDVQPVVGHRFTLDMGTFGKQQCEVLEVEPERRFVYAFGEGFVDTVIAWTLEREGDGTCLALEQSGFDTGSVIGKLAFEGMKRGWPRVLARIEPVLRERP